MKKFFAIVLTLSLVFACVLYVAAADGITVIVNGSVIEFDVPAQIVDGRTLIPLRAVSEALGKDVAWNGAARTATITG